MSRIAFAGAAAWAAVAVLAVVPVAAEGGPEVVRSARIGLSQALRDLPPAVPVVVEGEAREINPLGAIERPVAGGPLSAGDAALQEELSRRDAPVAVPAPTLTFDGMNNTFGVLPPDTTGDVGPSHYVQMVNLGIAVYDKATGAVLMTPRNINTLWAGFGGRCQNQNNGDPIVLYDPLADRWLVSQFAVATNDNHQCIAISRTGDPTGAYWLYDFAWGTKLNDYPHFGVWPDGYYMTVNQFTTTSWAGGGVAVFERDAMLAGATARMVKFDLGTAPLGLNYGGQLPADLDGHAPPPPGTPGFVLQWDDTTWMGDPTDTFRVWRVHVDWANPAASTFGANASYAPNHFLTSADATPHGCTSRNCIPQAGASAGLDAIADGRLMYRLAYRHLGTHDALVGNLTVGVGTGALQAAPRWFEMRGLAAGSPAVHQQGTYAPDALHRWMGSVAMDGSGNLLLGYSQSSVAMHPALAYTGRLATDPLNQLPQGEATLYAGAGSQTSTSNRWGDYSTMSVDPRGECTFWYTNEYYAATTSGSWRTRIGSVRFPECRDTLVREEFESGSFVRWSAKTP